MGFWNNLAEKIKGVINRSKTKRLEAGQQKLDYMFATSEYGDYSNITNLEFENQVAHSDGRIGNLMVARIANGRRGDAVLVGTEDYVAFELPVGEPITQEVLNKLVGNYLYEKNYRNNQECVYIGEINGNPQETQTRKSSNVEQYVNTQISTRIREERQQREAHRQMVNEKARQDKMIQMQREFEESLRAGNERREFEEQRRQQIRENPYIRLKGKYIDQDGKYCQDYDGVNVESGNFLRIRKLNEVTKDGSGRYIYTAYIQNVFNETDAEILNKNQIPQGIPVCFATEGRVEDIVAVNNPYKVRELLSLFSQERNFRNNNGYMNYIGNLDRYGNITNEMISQATNVTSLDNNNIIAQICNEAYRNYQNGERGAEWRR